MAANTKKRVGILRGGTGEHYSSSIARGGEVISYILDNLGEIYKPADILVDKDYVWHLNGLPVNPSDLPERVDVVWNLSHPSFSNILDSLSIPTVSNSLSDKKQERSKEMLHEQMKKVGVAMPRRLVIPVYQRDFDGPRERYSIKKAKEVFEKFPSPWIVKSFTPELNMGMHLAQTFNELVTAIEDGVKHGTSIIVEEFITGKVASVHTVAGFRGEDSYVFPPVNVFGDFSPIEREKLSKLAKDLHSHMGTRNYLKLDFILNKRGKVYLLELESMPNLKPLSHFAQACESVGAKVKDVVEHMLEKASYAK